MLNPAPILSLSPIREADPLFILSIILLAGLLGGWIARRLRLPSVTGNILAGVLLGFFNVFDGKNVAEALQPLSMFAMGLITVAVVHTIWQFFGAFLVGVGLGMITEHLVHKRHVHDFNYFLEDA